MAQSKYLLTILCLSNSLLAVVIVLYKWKIYTLPFKCVK